MFVIFGYMLDAAIWIVSCICTSEILFSMLDNTVQTRNFSLQHVNFAALMQANVVCWSLGTKHM